MTANRSGEHYSFHSGSWRSPAVKRILVQFTAQHLKPFFINRAIKSAILLQREVFAFLAAVVKAYSEIKNSAVVDKLRNVTVTSLRTDNDSY